MTATRLDSQLHRCEHCSASVLHVHNEDGTVARIVDVGLFSALVVDEHGLAYETLVRRPHDCPSAPKDVSPPGELALGGFAVPPDMMLAQALDDVYELLCQIEKALGASFGDPTPDNVELARTLGRAIELCKWRKEPEFDERWQQAQATAAAKLFDDHDNELLRLVQVVHALSRGMGTLPICVGPQHVLHAPTAGLVLSLLEGIAAHPRKLVIWGQRPSPTAPITTVAEIREPDGSAVAFHAPDLAGCVASICAPQSPTA